MNRKPKGNLYWANQILSKEFNDFNKYHYLTIDSIKILKFIWFAIQNKSYLSCQDAEVVDWNGLLKSKEYLQWWSNKKARLHRFVATYKCINYSNRFFKEYKASNSGVINLFKTKKYQLLKFQKLVKVVLAEKNQGNNCYYLTLTVHNWKFASDLNVYFKNINCVWKSFFKKLKTSIVELAEANFVVKHEVILNWLERSYNFYFHVLVFSKNFDETIQAKVSQLWKACYLNYFAKLLEDKPKPASLKAVNVRKIDLDNSYNKFLFNFVDVSFPFFYEETIADLKKRIQEQQNYQNDKEWKYKVNFYQHQINCLVMFKDFFSEFIPHINMQLLFCFYKNRNLIVFKKSKPTMIDLLKNQPMISETINKE